MLDKADMGHTTYVAFKHKWESNVNIKTLNSYIRFNQILLRYILVGVFTNTYISKNNHIFDKKSLKDLLILHELRNLCELECTLYSHIFLYNDFSLVDEVKMSLNAFYDIGQIKQELAHGEFIIDMLSVIKEYLEEIT